MKEYEITMPKPRKMSETPKEPFHYIYCDGTIGSCCAVNYFKPKEKVAGWIPRATVKENIVPGWCEYQVLYTGCFRVYWRSSNGKVSHGKTDKFSFSPSAKKATFLRQLTFEPEEELDNE